MYLYIAKEHRKRAILRRSGTASPQRLASYLTGVAENIR